MPKAYIIARVDVSDPDAYALYAKGAGEAMKIHGARIVVRGGPAEVLEGEGRARNVVLEFPSAEAARAYFNSPEYQAARQHRLGKAAFDAILVEGWDGPQP